MEFYGFIEILSGATAETAARMDFQPMQGYMDAADGSIARFCVKFTASEIIEQPRFNLYAGGALVGSYEAAHMFVPVGEGIPFYVDIPITDASRFATLPRVTRLSIGVDTAAHTFLTLDPAECGVDALRWRLAPAVSIGKIVRCDAEGRRRPDGIRGRLEGLRLMRREEWSGDASALTVRAVRLISSEGVRYDRVLTDAMLNAALGAGYTETVPALLSGIELDAGVSWTITITVGFSADNISETVVTVTEAFANMHLSGASTGGVCFGGFSRAAEDAPMLESRYPAFLYAGLTGLSFYPEGEQIIGRWIDGRPIYAKCFRATGIPGTTGASSTLLGTVSAVRVIGCVGHIVRSDGRMAALPWIIDKDHYAAADVTGAGEVRLRHCLGSGTAEVFACVWYCKA